MSTPQRYLGFDVLSFDQPNQSHTPNARRQPRSTTGCNSCKKRKVKCDEKKPACSRCIERRVECPGYPSSTLKWSSKHEVHQNRFREGAVPLNRSTVIESHKEQSLRDYPLTYDNCDLSEPVSDRSLCYTENDEIGSSISPAFSFAEPLPSYYSPQLIFPESGHTPDNVDAVTTLPAKCAEFTALEIFSEDENPFTSTPTFHSPIFEASPAGFDSISADSVFKDVAPDIHHDQALTVQSQASQNVSSTPVPFFPTAISVNSDHNRSLPPSILHVPTVLIEYYFRNVCRECSTFDSCYNPFRSTIANMQSSSAPINYVIQSLAAAKLADDLPRMKIAGIEAQGKALTHLKSDIMATRGLENVSEDILCTILLLGMTTSWHVREDLGVEYFKMARSVVLAKSRSCKSTSRLNLEFYQNALKYWSMIVSLVSNQTEALSSHDEQILGSGVPIEIVPPHLTRKIMPHPWTGVSPTPLHLFGQVLQLIRTTRGGLSTLRSSRYSMAGVASVLGAITTAKRIEAQCWALPIPSIDAVEDTRDTNTPPIHHVLTAKAYLLSALLHIYTVFPDVLQARIRLGTNLEISSPVSQIDLHDVSMAHVVNTASVWPQRLAEDPHELWLQDIGIQIVECLQAVNVKSGTRVVHPPLLLSVSSALTFATHEHRIPDSRSIEIFGLLQKAQQHVTIDSQRRDSSAGTNQHVLRCRAFVIDRLETMHALMRFHAIENILRVVKEVWRRADSGSEDTFWMDIMHELRCETIFG